MEPKNWVIENWEKAIETSDLDVISHLCESSFIDINICIVLLRVCVWGGWGSFLSTSSFGTHKKWFEESEVQIVNDWSKSSGLLTPLTVMLHSISQESTLRPNLDFKKGLKSKNVVKVKCNEIIAFSLKV